MAIGCPKVFEQEEEEEVEEEFVKQKYSRAWVKVNVRNPI